MGNGEYIRNLQNEGHTQLYGLGVELSDTRHEEDKLFDGVYGNDVVVGDILEKVTWDNIRKKLKGASPDFIVCNGE